MNLTSCLNCGVVVDRDNIEFPDIYDHDSQEPIMENLELDGNNDYVAIVPCPVCGENIREKQ